MTGELAGVIKFMRKGGVVVTKILIVEDALETRDLMKTVLELKGFEVVLATDGIDGIEQACAELPDLIITDLAMPRLGGLEMIQKVREIPNLKYVPILAITSYGMRRAMSAIRVGANRALARPIQNHLLLAFVFDLLKKSE
ncbi:MAG: response regulator [Blastocatellia bacterium]